MPKLTIEFQIPEEEHEARCAQKANDLYSALFRMRERILKDLKHSEMSREMERGYYECFEILNQQIEEHNLEDLFK